MSVAQTTRESRPEPTKFFRWLVLIFLSLAMFGNYYFYDALEPLAKLLQDQLHFSAGNIGTLQAAYSFPNIFTVVLGGILIDRIGTRKALLIFSVLCLIGAIMTALGAAFPMMVAGRFVFGMGAESLIVAITTGVAKWFKGKELSFALGINLMIARGGTFLAQNSPTWAKGAYNYWQNPWLIGVGFVALCVVGAIGYYILEVRAEKTSSLAPDGEQDKIVFADVKAFNLSYWYLVGLCVVFYSAIFPFETFAVTYFVDAKHTSLALGGWMLSTLTMFTMIGTPIVGLVLRQSGTPRHHHVIGHAAADPGLPADGLHQRFALRSHGHAGIRLYLGPGHHLAVRRLPGSPAHPGYRAGRDDHDSESRHDGNE